ncbi:hypothetical protein BaRGS_00004217 [Batillaria attramentaria]|uniref:Chromo domain-containing protein n=1 Tax=Batillaria attramentaria TaxID=370345 RepID=A0ABD0LZ41_9CAEN
MSSGEEFEVDQILEQRKRKGKLEYLIRWQGFGEENDTWEPASSVSHLSKVLKAFQAKTKRSRSKSRSRSRGRPRSQSSSRSRSRSRSASRRAPAKKSPTRSSRKSASTGSVAKKEEPSPVKQETRGRPRSRTRLDQEASTSKTEVVTQSSTRRRGPVTEEKTEVVRRTVETVKATPVTTQTSTMQTRSRLAVRQVQNDQKAAEKPDEQTSLRLWWFADHAVLLLFIIVSIIAISFCVESFAELRTTLTPDFGVLRERLGHMWEHLVQSLTYACDFLMDLLPAWDTAEQKSAPVPPKTGGS